VPKVTFILPGLVLAAGARQSGRMLTGLRSTLDRAWRQDALASPLLAAAVVAWAAVWLTTVGQLSAQNPALAWPARAGLILFMLCFLLSTTCEGQNGRPLRDLGYIGQLLAIFFLFALGRSGSTGILMVLFVASFTLRFSTRIELALLGLFNAALFSIMTWRWGMNPQAALTVIMAWGGFQAFAALTMRYAKRSERMADELRTVNADLLATRSLLEETARDQERLRLSRELHDVAGHKLTALKLNLRALERKNGPSDHDELAVSAQLVDELLDELRGLVRHLRSNDGLDLREALDRLARPLPRPKVEIEVKAGSRVPRAEQAEALLRVAQEALTNAARHGAARRAWLVLGSAGDDIELCIDDDGQVRWPLSPGNGLTGMRERVQALGGCLQLAPSPRGGLSLRVTLPRELLA
jgi:signal transduction histidine kinase